MKLSKVKIAGSILLVLAVLSAAYIIKNRIPFAERPPAVGTVAPDIALSDLSGRMVSLSDFEGKVVLINFWASWCPPCKEEMPLFQKVYEAFEDHGFGIIAIAVDDVSPDLVRELGISFPVVKTNARVNKAYGDIADVPVSFLIGKDGRILKKKKGFYPGDELKKDVEDALGQKHASPLSRPVTIPVRHLQDSDLSMRGMLS